MMRMLIILFINNLLKVSNDPQLGLNMQPSIPGGPDEQVFDMLMKNDTGQKNQGGDP